QKRAVARRLLHHRRASLSVGGPVPTVSLPLNAGTTRTAGLHPEIRSSEHAETPFAALLDTGVGPRISQKSSTRTPDRSQRPDTAARTEPATPPPERATAANETASTSDKPATEAEPQARDIAAGSGDDAAGSDKTETGAKEADGDASGLQAAVTPDALAI